MSVKTDPRIDAYIARSAEFAQPILRHLRGLAHRGCPEAEETLKWSMPSFVYHKQILCGMAAFKAHCTFGFWHVDMEPVIAAQSGSAVATAMGSFGRLASLKDLPNDKTLLRWIGLAMELIDSGKPGRPRPAGEATPRPELLVPDDLVALLKKNKSAAAAFEKFRPSHRREYVEWIAEAKREETRQKRLATTIELLAEGKSLHWKYVNC